MIIIIINILMSWQVSGATSFISGVNIMFTGRQSFHFLSPPLRFVTDWSLELLTHQECFTLPTPNSCMTGSRSAVLPLSLSAPDSPPSSRVKLSWPQWTQICCCLSVYCSTFYDCRGINSSALWTSAACLAYHVNTFYWRLYQRDLTD